MKIYDRERKGKTETVKRKGPMLEHYLKPWVSAGRFILKGFEN